MKSLTARSLYIWLLTPTSVYAPAKSSGLLVKYTSNQARMDEVGWLFKDRERSLIHTISFYFYLDIA
jgi:hypothetical protein